ncbi:MAG: lamin tail domain-containing protein, partial [Planctomycetota bacterium]
MITFFKRHIFLLSLTIVFTSHASATMRITEYMYSGISGEFVEFTNVGGAAVNMADWSFSDENRDADDFDLSAFGLVQPGESVILTESPAEQFRTAWGLSSTTAIIGELGVNAGSNLGRSDEINLYDNGTLMDRLTYSDEDFPGMPRASGASAWVASGGVGWNDPYQWALSVPGDDQGSWSSSSDDIGSPGAHQDAPLPPQPLPGPVFSQPGGMYNTPITVGLSTTTPGAVIRYTLDASVPTETSPVYSSPLSMVSLVGTANTISEIVTSDCDGYGAWQPPAGEVFKANTLRARVFKSGEIPSKTVSRTYFIDPAMTTRYSMPVVSLITEPDNLFDYETGIYVPGADENYYHRGDEWERDVHVEFIDGHLTGTPSSVPSAFAQDAGMRIHGGFTRCFARKSLRLYARSEYGASRIDYPVFGPDIPVAPESFKRLILRNGGNECYRT